MSRKVYVGTGSSKKVKNIYVGISGASRRVKSAYVGVGSSAKKFWPIQFKWARYSVSTQTYYTESRDNGREFYSSTTGGAIPYMPNAYSSYSFNSSDGSYSLSNIFGIAFRIGTRQYDSYCSYNGLYHLTSVTCSRTSSSTGQTRHSVSYFGEPMGAIPHTTDICGSFIDYVYSETRTAYPDNAQSGSYWYVYQGEA